MSETHFINVKITTEYITLGQFLKYQNIISEGSLAKSFINEHLIKVNDEENKQRGKKLYPGYKINIDDKLFFEIVRW